MLPVPLDADKLKGTAILDHSLNSHKAKFHKFCKLKFGKEKLDRAIQKYNSQKNDIQKTEKGNF